MAIAKDNWGYTDVEKILLVMGQGNLGNHTEG